MSTAIFALLIAAATAAPAAGVTGDFAGAGARTAAVSSSLPGRFVVQGSPLVKRGRVVAGRSISVFARPAVVVVEGCRSRSVRVRSGGRRASVSALVTCKGVRGTMRLEATISGRRLRGGFASGRRERRFVAVLARPTRDGLLRGRSSARAIGKVTDVDDLARHPDSEVSLGSGGARIARTELDVRLRTKATVGQVNAALRSVGGHVVGSLENSPRLVVAIPDPGGVPALDAVIAGLARSPGVEGASRAEIAVSFSLPQQIGSPPTANNAGALRHLLAMRMPAAWNALRAIQTAKQPTLIVVDKFGDGALSPYVDATCVGCALLGVGNPDPASHGYHVVGIAAGSFANDGTQRGLVTGVFPAKTRLKVVDLRDQTVGAGVVRALQAVKDTPGQVVLNTSFGHSEVADRDSRDEGNDWLFEVRTAGLTGRFVHAAAAGNDARPAELFSEWNAAALRRDLTFPGLGAVSPLPNTLITENLVDSGAPAYEASCRALASNSGGQIAAVGTNVFSHIKRREGSPALVPSGAGELTGTSQAAPQVAALAEYLWSIAPDLTATQIAALLIRTARPPADVGANSCQPAVPSAPRLDAYAAVLSVDQPASVTPAGAPVRLAILDRNGDTPPKFDEADLAAHAAALQAPNAATRDWSRSDLNGDGFTGVGTTPPVPLDLDPSRATRDTAPSYSPSVSQTIEGGAATFNETQVTDLEVLCYYAYSALYTGSPGGRTAHLVTDLRGCGQPLQVAPQSASVAPGATVQFTAKVQNATDSSVAWAASGGSIDQAGLYAAPSTPGSYVVVAADATDPSRTGTATVTVLDPGLSGKFNGTSTLCETEPELFCFPAVNAKALLEVSGNDFTIYMRSADQGWGSSFPMSDCNALPAGPRCDKFTGTRTGSTYTGVQVGAGVNPSSASTFQAALSADVLSGRIDEAVGGNGDFKEFTMTHDPD